MKTIKILVMTQLLLSLAACSQPTDNNISQPLPTFLETNSRSDLSETSDNQEEDNMDSEPINDEDNLDSEALNDEKLDDKDELNNEAPSSNATSNPLPVSTPQNLTVSSEGSQDHVSNGRLTLILDYQGSVELQSGSESWTTARREPYVSAAKKWLNALVGIEGKSSHTITMQVTVKKLEEPADGTASVEETENYKSFTLSKLGTLNINNHTYEPDFEKSEFNANILHEMGHVFGFGEISMNHVTNEPINGGNIFRVPQSKAVEMYQKIYGVNFDFVPMSDNGAHVYDSVKADDKNRTLESGQPLPPLTHEFMANGTSFGKVSLAILDDIGYDVDYSQTEDYTP